MMARSSTTGARSDAMSLIPLTLWQRLQAAIEALGNRVAAFFGTGCPAEASDAFAMAVVALGAKMAKSDGRVTCDEVRAFREVFLIEEADLPDVARLYDLARQDVAGFDLYARRIAVMFEGREEILETLLDGLFYIAQADGELHENEILFLETVAEIFGLSNAVFDAVRLRNLPQRDRSAYDLLGVSPDMPVQEIRRHWRKLAARLHPDRLQGEGVPPEALRLTEQRLADVNAAWDSIRRAHAVPMIEG